MAPSRPPVVRILAQGVALTVASTAGCFPHNGVSEPPPGNPPEPEPPKPPPEMPRNPPPPEPAPAPAPPTLPDWASVASDHPAGATNPPRPVLVALADGSRCWKAWVGGMIPPAPDELKAGGKVITDPAQAGEATEIQCPPDRLARLLDHHSGTGN